MTLFGGGSKGRGEDITYDEDAHDAGLPEQSALPVAGAHTIDSLSRAASSSTCCRSSSRYERWGFEAPPSTWRCGRRG